MDEALYDESRPVGAGWGWLMAYGVLSLLLGLAALVWPFSATFAATVVVGVFFLIAGIASIAAGLMGGAREGRAYAILFGLVSLFIGAIMLFDPLSGALSLTLVVAIWLGVRGVMEFLWGVRFTRHRGWMIALGVVNVLLALIILATISWTALTLPGYILGISFLFAGIVEVTRASHHRKGAAAFAV
ncbi:MAG: HdeD family acid-resistance protein [Sphingomonas sp.]